MTVVKWSNTITVGDNTYYYRPNRFKLPTDESDYINTVWNKNYSWQRLAYMVYGDQSLYWLIWLANDIQNPWDISIGYSLRILKPDSINKIEVADG